MAHKNQGPLPPGFEMKQCYQPNMLKSIGVVTFIAIVTGVVIRMSSSSLPQAAGDPAKRRAENQVHVSQTEKPVEKARQQFGGLNPYQKQHQGFAGFNGYKIAHDAPEVRPEKPPTVYALKPTDAGIQSDVTSYADVPGDSVGIGLPTLDSFDAIPPAADTVTQKFANQPLELISRKLPEIPWLAQENEREGHVDVLIYVDEHGKPAPYAFRATTQKDSSGAYFLDVRTSNGEEARLSFFIDSSGTGNDLLCLVIKEEPTEYSFAKNLTAVLPEWTFKPRIVNSKPVGSFVIVGFNYCVPSRHPEGCPEITLSST